MLSKTSSFCIVLVLCAFSCVYGDDAKFSDYQTDETIYETNHWALEIIEGVSARLLAEKHGHNIIGKIEALSGVFIFEKQEGTVHGITHPHFNESKEIIWFENQIARQLQRRDVPPPTDPLYSTQWHLHQTTGINHHINILGAWNQGLNGAGVTIAVVDDGLEFTHPDIAPNYRADSSYDFNYNDPSPFPDVNGDDHGTSAGGVAAARDNSACGVGSAYRAQLAGIRLISASTTDSQEASALTYEWNKNDIYTNSWGPVDDGRRLEGPGRLATAGLEQGTINGRNGKGTLYVWAGGNGRASGDNCNYDGWANSRFTMSVAAIDSNGNQAYYSESCSMLLVTAPSSGGASGITTTDLMGQRGKSSNDCRNNFGGTSSAAPLVAGAVAVVLQKNPELGWRDMQAVLLSTAIKHNPSDSDWQVNGGGFHVNHKFGFGLIDATAAVNLAGDWVNLGVQVSTSSFVPDQGVIPDGTGKYVSTVNITESFTIEHVVIQFTATHPRRGELVVNLISPFGTVSRLAEAHSDTQANYNWSFGSIFHWGEQSSGIWTLQVMDTRTGNAGSVTSWQLTLYGN